MIGLMNEDGAGEQDGVAPADWNSSDEAEDTPSTVARPRPARALDLQDAAAEMTVPVRDFIRSESEKLISDPSLQWSGAQQLQGSPTSLTSMQERLAHTFRAHTTRGNEGIHVSYMQFLQWWRELGSSKVGTMDDAMLQVSQLAFQKYDTERKCELNAGPWQCCLIRPLQ
eukprot:SAG11_NODE_4303_length_1960_cov_1.712520_1_plen_170_part_00